MVFTLMSPSGVPAKKAFSSLVCREDFLHECSAPKPIPKYIENTDIRCHVPNETGCASVVDVHICVFVCVYLKNTHNRAFWSSPLSFFTTPIGPVNLIVQNGETL